MNQLDQITRSIEDVPALPTAVNKIIELAQNPAASAKEMNQLISVDPVLTGRVLKLINSAYYSPTEPVTSIVKAIIMLGINTIKNLALSAAVVPTMKSFAAKLSQGAISMEGFWRHSLATGVVAQLIATHIGVEKKDREEYFIAGLLHDIGKLLLSAELGQDYVKIVIEAENTKRPLYQIEEEKLGFTHELIGCKLAQHWGLTHELIESITYHHNPQQCGEGNRKVVAVINIANNFSNANHIGFAGNSFPGKVDTAIYKMIDFDPAVIYEWEQEIDQQMNRASIFLKLQE